MRLHKTATMRQVVDALVDKVGDIPELNQDYIDHMDMRDLVALCDLVDITIMRDGDHYLFIEDEAPVLSWDFEEYTGKIVICNYITHVDQDNVLKAFDDLIDAEMYMDEYDLWDEYYIYEIRENGKAYAPRF